MLLGDLRSTTIDNISNPIIGRLCEAHFGGLIAAVVHALLQIWNTGNEPRALACFDEEVSLLHGDELGGRSPRAWYPSFLASVIFAWSMQLQLTRECTPTLLIERFVQLDRFSAHAMPISGALSGFVAALDALQPHIEIEAARMKQEQRESIELYGLAQTTLTAINRHIDTHLRQDGTR